MSPAVIDPAASPRAEAYALWMNAPDPMLTFFKTLDVTPLLRFARRHDYRFNALGRLPVRWRSSAPSLWGGSSCATTPSR